MMSDARYKKDVDRILLEHSIQKKRIDELESIMTKVFGLLCGFSEESVQESRDLIYKEIIKN